jgi:serine/threonine-protein kinase
MAVPFDLDRLTIAGQPAPAIGSVMQALNIGSPLNETAAGQFSISASGALVYAGGGTTPEREESLVSVDQRGAVEPLIPAKAPYFGPRLSPDGQRVAYLTLGREFNLWVYDLARGTATRLAGGGRAGLMTWSPDGKRLVFAFWKPGGVPNLYWQAADGSSPMQRLTTSEYSQSPGPWSSDGKTLVFVEEDHPDTGGKLLLLDFESRRVTPFLASKFHEKYPELSPDGRWLASCSDESGRDEVYLRPFPGAGGKWQISHTGGTEPLWARDGKMLFYRLKDQVWAVDIQTGPVPAFGKPRLLFEQPGYSRAIPSRGWDLSLDGRRFLMVKLEEQKPTPVTELMFVQNWFEELKRLNVR